MTLTFVYDPRTRKTVIRENSLVKLAATYKKRFFHSEWVFYQEKSVIGKLTLSSKLFSWKAVVQATIAAGDLAAALTIYYEQTFSTYLLRAISSEGEYNLYPHRQDKFSIFLNGKQIGALVRIGKDTMFSFDLTWALRADARANKAELVLLAFAAFLLGDKAFTLGDTYALGDDYWLKEVKEFNPTWQPITSSG